jgi:hypothetical protein
MSAAGCARTSEPPYYAVIFTSTRTLIDEGYAGMADRMVDWRRNSRAGECGTPWLS